MLTITEPCEVFEVSHEGYYSKTVDFSDKKVVLEPLSLDKESLIDSVEILDQSDPRALALLKEVEEKYKQNSPSSLDSYRYVAYEKLSLDFAPDSLATFQKYVKALGDKVESEPDLSPSKKQKKDSLRAYQFRKFIAGSNGFLWERATKYQYNTRYGKKTTVLDSKVSGLTEPNYQLLSLGTKPEEMPRILRKENRNLYRFFLSDTLQWNGRETLVIHYSQRGDKTHSGRPQFSGRLLIDEQMRALVKVESQDRDDSEGWIQEEWQLLEGKWFPKSKTRYARLTSFKLDPKVMESEAARLGYFATHETSFLSPEANIDLDPKEMKGYELEVENYGGKTLDSYRTSPLTKREESAYEQIDSLSQKHRLEQRANLLSSIARGRIRLGAVDLLPSRMLKLNHYEGLRLGVVLKLNEKVHPYISPDAYLAYGFKDKEFKYGAGVDVRTSLSWHSVFRLEYYKEALVGGLFSEDLWNFRMRLMNSGVNLANENYISSEGFKLSYERDLGKDFTARLALKKEENEALFDYSFKGETKAFEESSLIFTLKYAPQTHAAMAPYGRYTYQTGYPELYLNYERGLNGLNGESDFHRLDFLFTHSARSLIGKTGIRLYGGKLWGEVPIWHHFQMNGLARNKDELKFGLSSYLGFATMPAGKYYSDQFVGYYLTQELPWYFKSFGKNTSSIDILYRGAVGSMKDPLLHGFQFDTLDKLYQEVGLEWNNFLSTRFNLGFFYRVGPYQTSSFKDNFALQLKLKLLGF